MTERLTRSLQSNYGQLRIYPLHAAHDSLAFLRTVDLCLHAAYAASRLYAQETCR